MPPGSAPSWPDIREAGLAAHPGGFPPVCPQLIPDLSNGTQALLYMTQGRLEHLRKVFPMLRNQSEDCLFLNVFAPAAVGGGGFGVRT